MVMTLEQEFKTNNLNHKVLDYYYKKYSEQMLLLIQIYLT